MPHKKRKILVCQHVAYEPLGTLDLLLKNEGFRIRYVNFGRDPQAQASLEGYSGLIILGGPMNMDQKELYPHLTHEIKLVEEALKQELPVLGICLGAQLIAETLGAMVKKNREKEIGWYDLLLTNEGMKDPVFQHFSPREKIFQWHGDTFDLPKGAAHLASTDLCENQAFRFGNQVYGFQYHLEVDENMISRWLKVPFHEGELRELKGKIDPEKIREETPQYIGRSIDLSQKTFGEFSKLFGPQKKFKRLSYR